MTWPRLRKSTETDHPQGHWGHKPLPSIYLRISPRNPTGCQLVSFRVSQVSLLFNWKATLESSDRVTWSGRGGSYPRRSSGLGERVSKSEWLAVDVETTGLSPVRDRICEIAAIRFDETTTTDEWASLVRSSGGRSPSRTGQRLHGVSAAMLERAPDERTALLGFVRFASSAKYWLAHNASFDLAFVGETLRRTGVQSFRAEAYCTLRLARRLLPSCSDFALAALVPELEGEARRPHRARSDARAVVELFRRLLTQVEGDPGLLRAAHGPPMCVAWRTGPGGRP